MKKIILYSIFIGIGFSCSDFLEIDPENKINSSVLLTTERDLEIYANGFIQNHMPSEEILAWGDQYADNIATRTSSTFLIGDSWNADQQGDWSSGNSGTWSKLRNANYFLDNMPKAENNVSEEIYRHYQGVGRFWRAYFYYDMVRRFGDVPWYDSGIAVDDVEQLYKPRDSREYVMDKVLEDLTFAAANCLAESKFVNSSTRVSKWVALALKSRVCLFEGTYRKYHTELNLMDSANKFLEECVKASEELMQDSPYSLVHNPGNIETQYRSLFNSENLNETEIIFGLAFQTDLRMHSITWKLFSASYGSNWSLAKQFVNQYLMRDGSRFTDQPGYETFTYDKEFANRDLRLKQTVLSPDYIRKISGTERLDPPNLSITSTGYQPIKWAIDDDVHVGMATSYNSISMFRYAEVLLNYAEAKAELNQFDETVWNQTIRLLRERAGVNGDIPANYDPYLADYFLNQTTDKWILEVRRERGIELVFENVRYDDIMRWKLGELIERIWQGIYIPQKGISYDLNGDGINDVAVVDEEPEEKEPGVTYVVLGSAYKLSEGDHGYIEFGFSQNRTWSDKKYLRPVPNSAIRENPALKQNPGW